MLLTKFKIYVMIIDIHVVISVIVSIINIIDNV